MAFTFVSCQQVDFDEDFQTATTESSTNSKFNVSLSDVKFFYEYFRQKRFVKADW